MHFDTAVKSIQKWNKGKIDTKKQKIKCKHVNSQLQKTPAEGQEKDKEEEEEEHRK